MNNSILKISLITVLGLTTVACNSSNDDPDYLEQVSYDLSATQGEWQPGFSDYPVGKEQEFELTASENADFLLNTGEIASGFLLHSVNRSDDTQMYISRKITGLAPDTFYDVTLNLTLASNVNDLCQGIGGAPHAVTIKAGLSREEPVTSPDELDHYRLNLDVGNQTQGGLDAQALGDIAIAGLPDCDPSSEIYGLKTFENNNNPFEVLSDEYGELWLILLTDSGFEGPSSLYFTGVSVDFTPSSKTAGTFSHELDFSQEQVDINTVFYDYPVGEEVQWQLTSQPQTTVTLEEGGQVTGHFLHSYNRSDDTGMLLHQPIKGLTPNSHYNAVFTATIATNVNNSCAGIGGAPHAVTVKAGLSLAQPEARLPEDDNHYRLNINLGNNSETGEDGVNLGDIGADNLADCDPSSNLYGLKTFDSQELAETFSLDTDNSGIAYFSVATDSGFEGPTSILFTKASVTFTRID